MWLRRLEVVDSMPCGHVLQLDQHVKPRELCEGHVLVGCRCKGVHNVRIVPCGKLLSQRRHREPLVLRCRNVPADRWVVVGVGLPRVPSWRVLRHPRLVIVSELQRGHLVV